MPIRVTYEIKSSGKLNPVLASHDRNYAYVELKDRQLRATNGENFYMAHRLDRQEPMSKADEYLLLVYDVRILQYAYFHNGRKKTDLEAALKKETELDNWNKRTRAYIDSHPGFQEKLQSLSPDSDKARHFAFFQVVEEWRHQWKEYFAYKKRNDKDQDVDREMKKKCFDLEHAIDNCISKTLKL